MHNFLWNYKNMRQSRQLIQISIWKEGIGILGIDTQLKSMLNLNEFKDYQTPPKYSQKIYDAFVELNT